MLLCMEVENRSEALWPVAFSASNACFARDEPKPVGGVELSRKPPKLRSWRCMQPRAAKATSGVAVVGKMTSIPRALLPSCDIRCWRTELEMRHADQRRAAAAAGIEAKPASAL